MRRFLPISSGLILSVILTADAAQPVYDAEGVAKATETINSLKKQTEVLVEANSKAQSTIDAVGAKTKIKLPMLNLPKIARQLNRDRQCLTPDLESLMPGVEFEELDFGSICQNANTYKQTLTFDADDDAAQGMTFAERDTKRNTIRARRERVFSDAVLKAMAHGDAGIEAANAMNEAADALDAEADAATDMNSRLAVIAKGQAIQIRAQAQTNMLLSQLLKMQAGKNVVYDVPVDIKGTGGQQ